MHTRENSGNTIRVTEGGAQPESNTFGAANTSKMERVKRPMIFGLMAVVFAGCLYLIFKPTDKKKADEIPGLNNVVPQATDAGLQSDKQKAYEEEQLKEAQQQKRNALTSLSDYWTDDEKKDDDNDIDEGADNKQSPGNPTAKSHALESYKNAQSTIGSFYRDNQSETKELKRQIEELKEQIAQQEKQPDNSMENQLELMEKSYQMAAKYLPASSNSNSSIETKPVTAATSVSVKKEIDFASFSSGKQNAVSMLSRSKDDIDLAQNEDVQKRRTFITPTNTVRESRSNNSVRAVVQEDQEVTAQSVVRLRLAEAAKIQGHDIPAGTTLTAIPKFQNNRLQLQVNSVELSGTILKVSISIYDLDGQLGLLVPYSTERSALTEMAANMSQQGGSSLMLTQSAGQQIVGDLSRGVVQGVSGYLSKKVRIPKVTLKAGHEVFLVSQK